MNRLILAIAASAALVAAPASAAVVNGTVYPDSASPQAIYVDQLAKRTQNTRGDRDPDRTVILLNRMAVENVKHW